MLATLLIKSVVKGVHALITVTRAAETFQSPHFMLTVRSGIKHLLLTFNPQCVHLCRVKLCIFSYHEYKVRISEGVTLHRKSSKQYFSHPRIEQLGLLLNDSHVPGFHEVM